jgi:hypothetical protein
MKAIGLTTSEVLHSQNETGQTNELTNRKTICPNNIVVIGLDMTENRIFTLCRMIT